MKIYIASDHAGFGLKNDLCQFLEELGLEYEDKGAYSYDDSDDYPDFINQVAKEVSNDPENVKGVIIGASGQGEAISANRYRNVRAAVYYGGNQQIIKLSREHNDANVLSLGARFVDIDEAKEAIQNWLETPFSFEERHVRRIKKIDGENN